MAAAYNRRDAPKEWNLKHVAEGIFSFDDDFLETKPRNHEGEWIMVSIHSQPALTDRWGNYF